MTTYSNRIPGNFYVTGGTGESELTVHAGSFHFALQQAGIERANLMTYSSILPRSAEEIDGPQRGIIHGEVMECIMAQQSATYGNTATAGITWGWLYDEDGEKEGGLVCEYSG